MNVGEFLRSAEHTLQQSGSNSPRLDAQVIAAQVLKVDKGWLLAHPEHIFDSAAKIQLDNLLKNRCAHVPIAYLLGCQEFYGRNFALTTDVLIPRPETETLIDLLKSLEPHARQTLCDVGAGSGAIAVTAKLQFPNLQVSACDISTQALAVAQRNAEVLGAKVDFFKSDLLEKTTNKYDFIIANLPYVDQAWQRSPETKYEPNLALFAPDKGLNLIKRLIDQAPNCLTASGFLLLEADPRQHQAIQAYAKDFRLIKKQDFCLVLQKN